MRIDQKTMSRFKLFIENFFVYGVGGIISKAVPLLMLPLITRLMPDTYYFGLNDMSTVVISFGTALAVMGMYDAMFRMFFDKEGIEYKKDICSSALSFTLITSLVIFLIMVLFRKSLAEVFFDSPEYTNLLMLSAISVLVGATNTIVAAPTRMNNQRKIFLITNTLSPIISYGISIPLLMKKMYLVALPLSAAISAITIEVIFVLLNRKWFSLKRVNLHYIKQMLAIAIPLVPNFLIYWIFNSSDRLMITKLIGAEYTGIYAIGGKMGQVSQLIYTAFAGGWQYFAFSTMRDKDQVTMTSNIFEYLGVITYACGLLMTAFSDLFFRILFSGSYVQGATVAPYLFISPLLLMLFQVASNQLLVIKKTWPNVLILSGGAILNLVINYILIPRIGIEGAAIGTLLGYSLSVILVVVVLGKMKLLKISLKFLVVTLTAASYFILWRLIFKDNLIISAILALVAIIVFLILYKNDLRKLKKS